MSKNNKEFIVLDLFDVIMKLYVMEYKDIFAFLEFEFHKIFEDKTFFKFAEVRNLEENKNINLNKIYENISQKYNLDIKKLEIIKEKEIEIIINLCEERNNIKKLIKNKNVIIYSKKSYSIDTIKRIITKSSIKNIYSFEFLYDYKDIKALIKSLKNKYNKIHFVSSNWEDIQICIDEKIDYKFYPKCTDIFMGYINECDVKDIGLITKKVQNNYIDMERYTEITGVRCSLALIANKFFDNTNSKYDITPQIVGYYFLGMHLISICNWLKEISNDNQKIIFLSRDGYLVKRAYEIFKEGATTNYLYTSRKAYIPLIIETKSDMYFLNKILNIKHQNMKSLINLLKPILNIPKKIEYKEEYINFQNEQEFENAITFLMKYFDKEKRNKYFEKVFQYLYNIIEENNLIFDIGYSAYFEYILNEKLKCKVDAAFIHTNNSTAYNNSHIGKEKFKIHNFYDFKPKYSGTLRELLISDTGASCTGYKISDEKAVPILDKKSELKNKQKEKIELIQDSSIEFIRDFKEKFDDLIEYIDFNKYFMSLPFEFFMHKTKKEDKIKLLGKKFIFEVNDNEIVNLIDDWENNSKEV